MRRKSALLLLLIISFAASAQWYDFIGNLQFDPGTPNPPHQEGMMFYDNGTRAVAYYTEEPDLTLNVGQENVVRVRNVTGSTITDGSAVFVSGSTGTTPQITLAQADFVETTLILGVATHDIENNTFGYVTTFGLVNDIDTSAFIAGQPVYLSPDTAGEFVGLAPSPPSVIHQIGIIINSGVGNGVLLVSHDLITRSDRLVENKIPNSRGDAQFNPFLAGITTGNNATFGNGGVLSGTFASSTTANLQIDGARVYVYTQAAGSLNDWIQFPTIIVPEIVNTTSVDIGYEFKYKYDGLDDDIEVRSICVDDSAILLDSSNTTVQLKANLYKAEGRVSVPKDCNEMAIGVQVASLNSGAVLLMDNVKLSDANIPMASFNLQQTLEFSEAQSAMSDRGVEVRFSGSLTQANFNGDEILVIEDDASNTRTKFVAQVDCSVVIGLSGAVSSGVMTVYRNGSNIFDGDKVGANDENFISSPVELFAGDVLSIGASGGLSNSGVIARLNIKANATNKGSVFSSNVGAQDSMIRFHTGNGHGSTNTNIRRFTNFSCSNSGFGATGASETCGNITCTTSAASGTECTANVSGIYNVSYTDSHSAVANFGISVNSAQLTTTVISITDADRLSQTTSAASGSEVVAAWSGFLNSGDVIRPHTDSNPSATAPANFTMSHQMVDLDNLILQFSPKTCYVYDEKATGVDGGGFTSGAWQTRTLNTTSGDCGFVTLATDQITLASGKYEVEWSAPAFRVDSHKAKLYDITGAADLSFGSSESSGNTDTTQTKSEGEYVLDVTSPNVFEIRHYGQTTFGTSGFGLGSNSGDGAVERFTRVKIKQLIAR